MSYEEALVEDACCQASIEEISNDALNHYLGISKVVHHWNSYIERAIKEHPKLQSENDDLRKLKTALIDFIVSEMYPQGKGFTNGAVNLAVNGVCEKILKFIKDKS